MDDDRQTTPGRDLPESLSRLSGLAGLWGTGEVLTPRSVVDVAAQVVPHAHYAALTLLRGPGAPMTVAATGDTSRRVEELQYELGEGPALEVPTGPAALVSNNVTTDARWPRFGPACVTHTGIHSLLSLRLPIGGEDFAAINYYSTETDAFTDVDVTAASAIVPLAALAIEAELRQRDRKEPC